MRNEGLANLNFRDLIDYGGPPAPRNRYDLRTQCSGYCTHCDENRYLEGTGLQLDLMSHGCDSDDFERILGTIPDQPGAPARDEPILFLLDQPGADYGNGTEVSIESRGERYAKSPPVFHYYWTPDIRTWPANHSHFGGNFYGPYFAYLLRTHQLCNVYITNFLKCRVSERGRALPLDDLRAANKTASVIRACTEHFLGAELRHHDPAIVFAFGRSVEAAFREAFTAYAGRTAYLIHPSPRARAKVGGAEAYVQRNDALISAALERRR